LALVDVGVPLVLSGVALTKVSTALLPFISAIAR